MKPKLVFSSVKELSEAGKLMKRVLKERMLFNLFNKNAAAIQALVALATLVSTIVLIYFTVEIGDRSNELAEMYGRVSTYDQPLSYVVEIDKSPMEEGEFLEGAIQASAPIKVIPSCGGISKVCAVSYFDGEIASVIPLSSSGDAVNSYNANDVYWYLSNYTVPAYGKSDSGDRYGSLYLMVYDYQNTVHLNMITFTFEALESKFVLAQTKTFSEEDLLFCINGESVNGELFGAFNARQIGEFEKFSQLVKASTGNLASMN